MFHQIPNHKGLKLTKACKGIKFLA